MMLPNRDKVYENIRASVGRGDYNCCVEPGDPELFDFERKRIVEDFSRGKGLFGRAKRALAESVADRGSKRINIKEICGMENLSGIDGGAIFTHNHFSPLDSLVVRRVIRASGGGKLNICVRDSNFKMKGFLGFLMRNARTVPISSDPHYTKRVFMPTLEGAILRKEYILIYPEGQMWYNYRKPRPGFIGAYHIAAKLCCPIVPIFTEIGEENRFDRSCSPELYYRAHILPPIYPEGEKSVRENAHLMCERDNEEKRNAYERAYGRPYSSEFEEHDVALL